MGKNQHFSAVTGTARRPILSLPNGSSIRQPSLPSKAISAPPTANTRYLHPITGSKHFGLVPPIRGLAQPLCAAPIVLTHGWQTEDETGMGVCHIWKEHASELRALGYGSVKDVPDFVARIVKPGTKIIRLPDERGEPHRSPPAKEKAMTGQKFDIHATITAQIITAIEEGCPPWRKPWTGGEAGA